MIQRLEAEGNQKSQLKWDDGFDHDDVTKIYVRGCTEGIFFIRFDYVKNGEPIDGSFHGESCGGAFTHMFEVNSLKNEHLESVEIYYDHQQRVIKALQFKTNLRISEMIGLGYECAKFKLAVEGKKITGFHGGASDVNLDSLGAYFTWFNPMKEEAKGGKGGKEWDDGEHDDVTKIHVGGDRLDGIQFIKFEYIKAGQPKDGLVHGSVPVGGFKSVFEIKHGSQECLVSVEGYYKESTGVIQGLRFKTNINTSELMGYAMDRKFRVAANGMKIIGFHGYAEKNLNSLGAYFTTLTPTKLKCQGADGGTLLTAATGSSGGVLLWDDGAFEGLRKVYIYYKNSYINLITFDYENNGKAENRGHGFRGGLNGQEGEFVVDYPNEFITSVEGTRSSDSNTWITSLTFKTSQGRTSVKFGNERFGDLGFVFERNGCAFVGFHGQSYYSTPTDNCYLTAFGAYFYPMPSPPAAKKLEAKGGNGGASWDDGSFEGVRKIYIGISETAIAFVKFMYYKDHQMVFGNDHGNQTMLLHVPEFELTPNEFITSVKGCYDSKSGAITMLKFTTDQKTSPEFGRNTTSTFLHYMQRLSQDRRLPWKIQ